MLNRGKLPSPTLPPTHIFSVEKKSYALGPSLFCFKTKP